MKDDFIRVKDRTKRIFIEWQHRRVMKRNLNVLMCFTGNPGSGKSYAAIRNAELLSELNGVPFNVDNIVFTPKEFITLVNSKTLKKGSVIILDEAGVAVNSRKWQSTINLMMNYVVQTFRRYNYVVIMCVPYFDFIDSAIRKMFHVLTEVESIDHVNKIGWTRPKVIQINQRTGKPYYKFLRYKYWGEQPMALEKVGYTLSNHELLRLYELKKEDYTEGLNKGLQKELDHDENKAEELTQLQTTVRRLRNEFGLTETDIGRIMNVTQTTVSNHLMACKRKGFIINRAKNTRDKLTTADIQTIQEGMKTWPQEAITINED